MKKRFVFSAIAAFLVPVAAIATDLPNFSTSERILRIPQVTVDDRNLFYDVELYMDLENGIISVQKYNDTPPLDAIAELNLPFKLIMGRNTSVSGTDLQIQFSDVTDDRCPTPMECLIAGEVVVVIDVIRPEKNPEKITLTSPNSFPVIHNLPDYSLELLAVQPYPEFDKPIVKEDYMITLRVTPLQ